ncbi:MAG: AgmX/PglI C-terminal domain-containing protein [Myxococcota bacterium]|nr:AgmX/PglI C-terminal domain-containing protein [Myxococcota bacterium]
MGLLWIALWALDAPTHTLTHSAEGWRVDDEELMSHALESKARSAAFREVLGSEPEGPILVRFEAGTPLVALSAGTEVLHGVNPPPLRLEDSAGLTLDVGPSGHVSALQVYLMEDHILVGRYGARPERVECPEAACLRGESVDWQSVLAGAGRAQGSTRPPVLYVLGQDWLLADALALEAELTALQVAGPFTWRLGPKLVEEEYAGDAAPLAFGVMRTADIERVIKRNLSQVRYCYQRVLTRSPSLEGEIKVRFLILPDGSVGYVGLLEDTMQVGDPSSVKQRALPPEAVGSCIVGRVPGFRFPEPTHGAVLVTYPFIFEPG